jgi:alpha-beta hydrolase superfamily lysophospholipase
MATYVLVHGACHDGSAWSSVIERLEDRGHMAFTPTVAGHGPGANRRVTHAESAKTVVPTPRGIDSSPHPHACGRCRIR